MNRSEKKMLRLYELISQRLWIVADDAEVDNDNDNDGDNIDDPDGVDVEDLLQM